MVVKERLGASTVKIGDLVKYNVALDGLEKCLGVVIGFNGSKAISVQWFDSHAMGREFSCELAEFLDIVSENR
jgi:hypothetical protein